MTFDKLSAQITKNREQGIPFKDWVVHFEEKYENFGEDPIFYCTANVNDLYQDWYGDCTYCPENSALVWNVMFSNDVGSVFLIETIPTNYELDFETLMQFIEAKFKEQ